MIWPVMLAMFALGVIVGGLVADFGVRDFWRRYHYCPTCDRLDRNRYGAVREADQ